MLITIHSIFENLTQKYGYSDAYRRRGINGSDSTSRDRNQGRRRVSRAVEPGFLGPRLPSAEWTPMEDGRLNLPSTSVVKFEVLGHHLHLSQDPNSKHLGTTVWDASMVFVKFLEKNCRKGRFSLPKLKGKRAIELGAGCGLAGLGMALLGCEVISTDQAEVLPLLMRNVERNTSWIMQTNPDSDSCMHYQGAESLSGQKIQSHLSTFELDWGNKEHIKSVNPPFDYIIGTDVVYSEHLLEPLLQTVLALSGPKTTILIGYEIRSTTVHEKMIHMWKDNFAVKTIPKAKMDHKFQHPSIQLFMMELKTQSRCGDDLSVAAQISQSSRSDEDSETCAVEDREETADNTGSSIKAVELEKGTVDDWEIRRCGSMAARLFRDVKIT